MNNILSPEDAARNTTEFLQRVANGTITELDGVMSPATMALIEQHAAIGVDMTSWWSYTAPTWVCSGCGRPKRDLVRLNHKGELMCRLVEHHDHMRDLLVARFRSLSTARREVVANDIAEQFAKRSATMVSAYDNTIICEDCNSADANAKRMVGTHPDFSFSPGQLRRFVEPEPNQPHKISASVATTIWKENEETFMLRLKIIDRIADIAASNAHWFEPQPFGNHPDTIESWAIGVARRYDAADSLGELCGPKRRQKLANPSDWRKTQHKLIDPPSQGDIEHVARVSCRKAWDAVGEDWHCPACKRSKTEIVRPTNQFPWGFHTGSRYFLDHAARRGASEAVVCFDCVDVRLKAGMEIKHAVSCDEEEVSLSIMSLDELASIIIARPHSRHHVDGRIFEALLPKLVSRALSSKPACKSSE